VIGRPRIAHNSAARSDGYVPNLPTPFDTTGAINFSALRQLCEWQIAAVAPATALSELGLMPPDLRLPLVQLEGSMVREVARRVTAVVERDLATAGT